MAYWMSTLVSYFIEKILLFPVVQSVAMKLLKHHGLIKVISNNYGFYFFHFDMQNHMLGVFDIGPWHFASRLLFLRC